MQGVTLYNPDYIFSRFSVCGISYQKTDAATRGLFYITEAEKLKMLEKAKEAGVRSLFILSTCNRTEIYGYVPSPEVLETIFTGIKNIDPELFDQKKYIKKGEPAMEHLFSVAAGLDSQILGDYEILGQLKQSIAFSQQHDMIGPIMDRTINFALQASKKVKTATSLSSGTTSVSFAAIEWLKKNVEMSGKKIALIGLGKFGSTVGKNLKHYFPLADILVSNRTDEKAESFAAHHRLTFIPYRQLNMVVNTADIIIVSTQAAEATVTSDFLIDQKPRIFLDLSIPSNVDKEIANVAGQQVVDVDAISLIQQYTLEKRRLEIPKARQILAGMLKEFASWLSSYSHAPLVREMKDKLFTLSRNSARCEMASAYEQELHLAHDDYSIKKTISRLAVNLRTKNEKGCQLIEAYNHFLNHSAGA